MNRVFPDSTASMAGSANGLIFTNHCVDSSGSTTVAQRSQCPTLLADRFDLDEQALRFQIFDDLLARLEPIQTLIDTAGGVIFASSPITLICSRLCRWPISKSARSCAGVTFTTPVPNFGSTAVS